MVEIRSVSEFENLLTVPFLFHYGGKPITNATLQFVDDVSGAIYREDLLLDTWPEDQFANVSFGKLYSYLDPGCKVTLQNTIKTVFEKSSLYENSLLHVQIDFSSSQNFTTKRYFAIPSLMPIAQNSQILLSTEYVGTPVHNAQCVAQIYLNEENMIGYQTSMVLLGAFSDMVIMEPTMHTDSLSYRKEALSIVNYEMYGVLYYAVGKFSDSKMKLLAYNTMDQRTILSPNVSSLKGNVITEDSLKKVQYSLKVSCPVYNGLTTHDYGGLFIRNGFSLRVDGTPNTLLVSKKIGA